MAETQTRPSTPPVGGVGQLDTARPAVGAQSEEVATSPTRPTSQQQGHLRAGRHTTKSPRPAMAVGRRTTSHRTKAVGAKGAIVAVV